MAFRWGLERFGTCWSSIAALIPTRTVKSVATTGEVYLMELAEAGRKGEKCDRVRQWQQQQEEEQACEEMGGATHGRAQAGKLLLESAGEAGLFAPTASVAQPAYQHPPP